MQDAILSIVPHAFGDHGRCGPWCRFKENPKAYKHKYLPGGKDLTGNGVRAFLEETTAKFATSEYIKKLEQLGSTQRNESLNNVIGSKVLKIRYYGASESCDFRTAASVSQFNENSTYLVEVSAGLKHKTCLDVLGKYAAKYTLIRRNQSKRFSTIAYRRNRRNKKKKSKNATKKNENCEGITYETGIGVFDAEVLKVQKIVEKPEDTKEVNLWLPKKKVKELC